MQSMEPIPPLTVWPNGLPLVVRPQARRHESLKNTRNKITN
jgi:hypothetical protein